MISLMSEVLTPLQPPAPIRMLNYATVTQGGSHDPHYAREYYLNGGVFGWPALPTHTHTNEAMIG